MRKWFRENMQSEYVRRQIDLLSSLGLFYLIIVALFAVPLLATFVVVLIKGVLDFQYLILGGGIVVGSFLAYFVGRFCYRLFRRLKTDGASAIGLAKERASRGETVQLELLGGLFSLSYGGDGGRQGIDYRERDVLLLEGSGENSGAAADPVRKIKELSELKDQGIIDDDEFRKLKEKLIRDACEPR